MKLLSFFCAGKKTLAPFLILPFATQDSLGSLSEQKKCFSRLAGLVLNQSQHMAYLQGYVGDLVSSKGEKQSAL